MKILFFDSESTGLPKDYDAHPSNVDNFPRLVQLGFQVYEDGVKVREREYIICPDGFEIPEKAASVHGITTEKARVAGESLIDVLRAFNFQVEQCDLVVGHNVRFDLGVVGAEEYRTFKSNILEERPSFCTMLETVDFCGIPSPYYRGKLKWPKLTELWATLFPDTPYPQTHTALDDIQHTAECFYELLKRGVIKVPEPLDKTNQEA